MRIATMVTPLIVLLPLSAVATPRTVVIAAGDCSEHRLMSHAVALTNQTREKAEAQVVSLEELRDRLGLWPSRSANELDARIDIALGLLNEVKFRPAREKIVAVLEELDMMLPGPDRIRVALAAHEAAALISFANNREHDADEAFRTLLRFRADHRINRGRFDGVFSPSVEARFERLRRDRAKGRTAALAVKSMPSGAEVFLDGFPIGLTPLTVRVEPRTYQIQLKHKGAYSLPHRLAVAGDTSTAIDLAFEGSIVAGPALCLQRPANDAQLNDHALRLGTRLDADQVVLARVTKEKDRGTWFTATLIDVKHAAKVREGLLKIEDPAALASGIDELATFVVTGQLRGEAVVSADGSKGLLQPPVPPSAIPAAAIPPARKPFPWVPASLGAAGLGATTAGVVFALQAAYVRKLQEDLIPIHVWQLDYVLQLEAIEVQRRTWSIVSFGAGAVAFGAAAYLHFSPKKETPRASLSFTGNGAALTVSLP